jgi:Carboxypeptidase regulatory-like domain
MAAWPGGTIGWMQVDNFEGGDDEAAGFNETAAAQQVVTDATIEFSVDIKYTDHPIYDHGHGYFSVQISRFTTSGWEALDWKSKTLGNDSDDGDWSDSLVVSVTMVSEVELYQLHLHCGLRDTGFGAGPTVDVRGTVQAVKDSIVGEFTLDFVPVSIVYAPPGQDMTASLTQSLNYGTRFTLGNSSGFKSEQGITAKISDVTGLSGIGIGFSDSQSVSNGQTSGIEISHFRNTVVTADNQRAIGRAYWGPLGDLFVILVNPTFAASRRGESTLFYSLKSIQQVLIVPAWKLLRPANDPIASGIPAEARHRMLGLDPFIRNLDQFFPDSGADLSIAANPYADPSANNRAELIGRWWLDTGSELNYSEGETHQLFSTQTNQVTYESTVTINASVGAVYNGIAASLGLSASNTTSVGFQQSKETSGSYSRSASCLLIHNQNERDLDGIDLFYDKIFSTFMFRRVRARRKPGLNDHGALGGQVFAPTEAPLAGISVKLRGRGQMHETTTSASGRYSFVNLEPGRYEVQVGDHRERITIDQESSATSPQPLDLKGVRRTIDLQRSPVWEVRQALGVPSDVVQLVGANLPKVRSFAALARLTGVDAERVKHWRDTIRVAWPPRPRADDRRYGRAGRPAK